MSKARFTLAGTVLGGLLVVPALMIPASADTSGGQSSASTSSSGPLVSVCVTVTPKSLAVGINGQDTTIGPAGLPRTCVATPF